MIAGLMGTLLLTALIAVAAAAPLAAAEPKAAPGDDAKAIRIDARQGIEWQRPAKLVIARGDAKAVRGDSEVQAEVLTAHYRDRPDGSAEVWLIDADGDVRLTSPGQSAYGQKGTFDLDKDTLTLSGGKQVGITTATNKITAEKELEYHARTRTLIARGNAVAVDGERTLYGEVITILLNEQPQGQDATAQGAARPGSAQAGQNPSRLKHIEAQKAVRLVTPSEDIHADHGTYDVDSGIATLDGSVKIVKGRNELNGCRGEINLKTGISKLFACKSDAANGGRVSGVILPQSLGR